MTELIRQSLLEAELLTNDRCNQEVDSPQDDSLGNEKNFVYGPESTDHEPHNGDKNQYKTENGHDVLS